MTVDLKVAKQFDITDRYHATLYLEVWNLLNRKNTINVYSATGSPSDDGYLASSRGLDALESVQAGRTDAFLASYQWRMLNPGFYSLPRRMYVGALFNF